MKHLPGPIFPNISVDHLVETYPHELGKYSKKRDADHRRLGSSEYVIDGNSLQGQRAVTEATVREYFDAPNYTLSPNNLCPRVSNRLCYLETVERCLMEGIEAMRGAFDECTDARWILDIGTGSSLIYPIIGAKLEPRNHFVATECNQSSIQHARESILKDYHAKDRINLVEIPDKSRVFPAAEVSRATKGGNLLYAVCNPPFYRDACELDACGTRKKTPKHGDLRACDSELYYENDGEYGFMRAYIDQTREAAGQYACFTDTWFTCQVGIYRDLEKIREYCRDKVELHTLLIPLSTRRWIIAWTFCATSCPCPSAIAGITATGDFNLIRAAEEKLSSVRQMHPRFQFEITIVSTGNTYLVCNEAVWLRKVRRLLQMEPKRVGFGLRLVILLGREGMRSYRWPEVSVNTTAHDKVTLLNSLVSFLL